MTTDTRDDPTAATAISVSERPAGDGDAITPNLPDVDSSARRLRHDAAEWAKATLGPVWADRRIGLAAAVGFPALWGLLAGWWTPRGPLTTGEALWSIIVSLLVGGVAGLVWRSRWAMFASPITFAVVFELVRSGTDGPTVDGIETSPYGLIAFVVGRGFHGLLSLFPLLLGAALGAGVARQLTEVLAGLSSGRDRIGTSGRRSVAVLASLALAALVAGLARPTSTAAIIGADGKEIPGSVTELTTVEVNGHDLTLMIRGRSVDNPVLLFLAGGPGGSELGAMRRHLEELEAHFTVVTWDQRGTGTSYHELDPADTLTLQGSVDDTIVVTDYLRERFGQDRIHLLGQSWGTTLGVLAVQGHPERYEAFIGVGQMVSQLATDQIFYDDTLEWASDNGDEGLVDQLIEIGPPPYDRMLNYELALANEQEIYRYDHSLNSEGEGQMSENLLVSEYALIDQVHVLGGFMDTFSILYPQLQGIDFRDSATEFEIPMFFVQGAHEAPGRADVFEDWYPMIDAPIKDVAVFETSGHRPLWEQPDEFVDYMVDVVLAETGVDS